ncbi:MAG TPA: YicC family protein [Firmicutes bacterium]|nr:YicC family protein [Bacillota bacterium]
MIRSMTGYGQAESAAGEKDYFKVELRSVNHRYLDFNIRMPREIQALEEKVRRRLQQFLGRGRVEVYISWNGGETEAVNVVLDRKLLAAYREALAEMQDFCGVRDAPLLEILTRFPDLLRVEKAEAELDKVWNVLLPVLDAAAAKLQQQRLEEGARLEADLLPRLELVAGFSRQVEERAPLIVAEYRKKLAERLQEFLGQAEIDPARLLTEAAIFADRCNVTEELVRLWSHLSAFREALQETGPVGRKLDFLTQELFREVNTIGSKANDYEVARLVVEMKAELEKIREQVQNIE